MSPAHRSQARLARALEDAAQWAAHWTGTSWAFSLAVLLLLVWLIAGPLVDFSDTWQLVINTATTVITFVMVFLIQRAHNKDALATQMKLNEIVAAIKGASNRLIDVEDLSEAELNVLRDHFRALVGMAKHEGNLFESHSIEEAESRHRSKAAH
ncbi:MAG TPA: low affinity iron permease family protein [Polyangiaceae bacterium]|nr:low affinity iron permease family protein [Polyangiaceae bacterium]